MNGERDLVLTGLIGSNTLGALAAFGLLRVCSDIPALTQTRLLWRAADDWMAVLIVPVDVDEGSFLEHLITYLRGRRLDMFEWSTDVRVPPEDYRTRLIQQAENASYSNRLNADYYAAFGSEMVTDGSKSLVKPTAFHMTSGRQKFLKNISELGRSLQGGGAESVKEALFGPWMYEDEYHSLGWDPTTERMHALRHRAPTSENPRSVRAAVWFAVESLPLFPTAIAQRKLVTAGFTKRDGDTRLVWPIWTNPISLDTLKTLLVTSELVGGGEAWELLGKRDVAAIYEAVRSEFGQGYAILRPATLVWNAV